MIESAGPVVAAAEVRGDDEPLHQRVQRRQRLCRLHQREVRDAERGTSPAAGKTPGADRRLSTADRRPEAASGRDWDTLDSLGYIHHHLGDHAQAVHHYEQSVALSGRLGDCYTEATTQGRMGDTYLVLGDHSTAEKMWGQALTLLDRLSHPDAQDVRAKLAALEARPPSATGT